MAITDFTGDVLIGEVVITAGSRRHGERLTPLGDSCMTRRSWTAISKTQKPKRGLQE